MIRRELQCAGWTAWSQPRLVSGICHCQHSAELCDGDRHIQVMGPVLRNWHGVGYAEQCSLSGRIFDAEVVTLRGSITLFFASRVPDTFQLGAISAFFAF